jgi:hypothetical protein
MSKFVAEELTDHILISLRSSLLGGTFSVLSKSEISNIRERMVEIINKHLSKKRTFLENSAEQMEIEQHESNLHNLRR